MIAKAIAGQLSWSQPAEVPAISARQMRQIRWAVEHHGLQAAMNRLFATASRLARRSSGEGSVVGLSCIRFLDATG
ncbi:MAG: hypothetical protein WA005_02430 [Candidatus Binataceae bacterium]